MKRLVCVAVFVALVGSGCTVLESGTKFVFDAAWNAGEAVVKAKLPGLQQEVLDGAKAYADTLVDKGMVCVAEKSLRATDAVVRASLRAMDIDPDEFDFNRNGILEEAEFNAAVASVPEENQKWWYGILVGAAALSLTGGKSIKRWLAEKLANGGQTNGST